MLLVHCEHCHYKTELYEGSGMAGVVNEELECTSCRELVSVAVGTERQSDIPPWMEVRFGRCPECDGETFDQPRWIFDGDRRVECPKCRESAAVIPAGIWD